MVPDSFLFVAQKAEEFFELGQNLQNGIFISSYQKIPAFVSWLWQNHQQNFAHDLKDEMIEQILMLILLFGKHRL